MLANYFKTAFRNLFKSKSITIINILGLSVGIAVSLLMLTYVVYENSYDSFHKNSGNIYRVSIKVGKSLFASNLPAVGQAMAIGFPEVEAVGRIVNRDDTEFLINENEKAKEEKFFLADQAMLNILTFNFKAGDKASALSEPYSVIMNETKAKKYFGNENPLGKSLIYKDKPLKITGVFEDLPKNTQLQCEIVASYSTIDALGESAPDPWNGWGDDLIFVMLKKNTDINNLRSKLEALAAINMSPAYGKITFDIHNIKDIHWRTDFTFDIGIKGNRTYLYIFLITAILVLIIACFNFMNLSTAKFLDKSKEVGIRKVIGSTRLQVVKLFLTESFAISIISLFAGVIIFLIAKEKIYEYMGADIAFNGSLIFYVGLIIFALLILITFVAGSYPAYFLSKFNPAQTTKGIITIERNFSFRQVSTILQFSFSVFLIAGILMVNSQISYMKNADLGMDKNNIVLLFPKWKPDVSENNYKLFKTKIESNKNILAVTGAYSLPGVSGRFGVGAKRVAEAGAKSVQIQLIPADVNIINTFGMNIINGRGYLKDNISDAAESAILNETAVRSLNLTNPIGEKLQVMGKTLTVIGVVKDFHVSSLRSKINPCIIMVNPQYYKVYAVKIDGRNKEEAMAFLKTTWNSIFPDMEYDQKWLDDAYKSLYKLEDEVGNVLLVFTLLTIFVTCIGLFGFTQYMAVKKTKEIAVRKVLGAAMYDLLLMFSRRFIIWISIACVIGIPLAIYLVNGWLDNFAYRVEVKPILIVLSVAIVFIFALGTISFQAVKASINNPVENLRSE